MTTSVRTVVVTLGKSAPFGMSCLRASAKKCLITIFFFLMSDKKWESMLYFSRMPSLHSPRKRARKCWTNFDSLIFCFILFSHVVENERTFFISNRCLLLWSAGKQWRALAVIVRALVFPSLNWTLQLRFDRNKSSHAQCWGEVHEIFQKMTQQTQH